MTLALALAAGTAMPPARSQPDLHAELHADGAPWRGRIELPGASLDIVVRFAADEDGKVTRGTIDIPAQGAVGLPLGDISVDGARVSFRLPNVPGNARFSGELRGETLAGRFEQSGGRFPFELNRSPANAEPSPRRPQTPQPPFPYRDEEVTFHVPAADVRLAGTLTLPLGEAPFAAVILVSGSGAQDRNGTVFGHEPFRVWADYLARAGLAVLRTDDRGTGASERGTAEPTTADLAEDALAGVAYLASRADIGRIGIIGHSEGALVAIQAALRSDDIEFVVALAGPALRGDELLLSQAAGLLRAQGADERAIEWDRFVRERVYRAILDAGARGLEESARSEVVDDVAAAFRARFSTGQDEPARRLARTLLGAGDSAWFRHFLQYDPYADFRALRQPVLALYGENDLQVPAAANAERARQAFENGAARSATVVTLPGLNHLLQPSETGLPAEYARIEQTVSDDVLERVRAWIEVQLGAE